MKNSNLLFLLVLVCCGAFIMSCGKDDGPEGPDGTEPVVKINTIPEFYPKAVEANYGTTPPEYTVLLDRIDGVLSPNDLEFNPDPDRPNELWVLNPGTERTGASTVIVHGAGTNDQQAEYRIDGNAWHFMALATSLAFGDNGNFATSQGILDANRGYIPGVNFTGPTLWTADLNIYAVVGNPVTPTVNGSHLDMIHQSPQGMGIAHEMDNVYWVFDGFYGTLCRYDFVQPHYPGGPDHSDGKVWRYYDVKLEMDETVPSHMVLDKSTNLLYICNTGKNEIMTVDIETGDQRFASPRIPNFGEELALYTEMDNAVQSQFASNLNKPCGIALNENRLFVSEYATGNIICFDKESGEELGRLNTGASGIMGITIGPEGKLWYVDSKTHEVVRVDPAPESI